MPSTVIQWFPGHMAKTRRLITECLPLVDIVIEVLDARIPVSSRNPELAKLIGQKPKLSVFSKSALADPEVSKRWKEFYRESGQSAIFYDCRNGDNLAQIAPTVRELLGEKLDRYESKGMTGRRLKAMMVGIPNVGKSSLINALAKNSKAKVENRPGVTLNKQWITTSVGIDLLDMPGVLWPKFEDKEVGENLAITGAIKDDILDLEQIAFLLVGRLRKVAPGKLSERYKLGDMAAYNELADHELLEVIGRKRGFLVSGGEVDLERTSNMLIDEFRAAKIGRITLELPE